MPLTSRARCLSVAVVLSALCAVALPLEPTHFEGHRIVRLSLQFQRGCSATVHDLRAVKPLRSAHSWYPLSDETSAEWSRNGDTLRVADAVSNSVPQDFSPTAPLSTERHHVQRIIAFSRGGVTFAHAFLDPRFLRHHGGHHHVPEVATMMQRIKRAFGGGAHEPHTTAEAHSQLDTASEAFWLPADVDVVKIYCGHSLANATVVNLPDASSRSFHADAATTTTTPPEVHTLYNAGPPNTQFNIVFNSGGFRAQDRDMFIKNATAIANLLTDPSLDMRNTQDSDTDIANMHRSVPFNRYMASWNIYAVFQPSVDVGANRPLIGLVVNNNLGCTHPAQLERAVYCDQALSFSLASASPADVYGDPDRVVVINIVNTALYGGSAISVPGKFHMGNFFNRYDLTDSYQRKNMLSLVDHETGHAIGSLFDEYSIGISQPNDPGLQNCQIGNGDGSPPTKLKWDYWLTLMKSPSWSLYSAAMPSNWGVLSTPQAVCGYSNFYKPNSNCMMHRLNDYFMCPVCREASLKSIFRIHFSLAWPRYPLPDVVTVIGPATAESATDPAALNVTGQLVLHLPAHLTRGFQLEARDIDGTPLTFLSTRACMNCIVLNGTNFAKYPVDTIVTLRVDITDTSDYFLSPTVAAQYSSQLRQNTTFRLVVASSLSLWKTKKNLTLTPGAVHDTVGSHPSDLTSAWTFCEHENPSDNSTQLFCSMAFPNRTYAPPQPYPSFLAQYDGWILIALGGVAFFFLLLWGWAATAYSDTANGRVRPIFKTEFSCIIGLVRRIMQISAVVFLLASVATVGLAAYYYFQATSLGKIALIAGVIMAVILYLLAFIGYWAIASRSKRMLILNGGCLFVALGVMSTAFFIVIAVGQELQVESSYTVDIGAVNSAVGINSTSTAASQNGFWTNQLQSLWEYEVANDPKTACSLQDMLQCTGFYTNCGGQYPSTLVCPTGCDDVNSKWQSPCLAVFKDYVVSNYGYIAGITGGAGGLLLGGLALNIILFFGLLYMKRRIQNSNQARISKKIRDIHGESHSGGGGVNKPEVDRMKALYLLKSLDSTSTESLIREFKRIDKDGNGELDRKELVIFFTRCLYYKPTAGEIEEIYRIADRDGDGTISLVEFLKLFGAKDAEEAAALAQAVASPRRAPRAIGLTQMKKFGSTLNSKIKSVRRTSEAGAHETASEGSRQRGVEAPILAAPMLEASGGEAQSHSYGHGHQQQHHHVQYEAEDLDLGPTVQHHPVPQQQQQQQQARPAPFDYDDLL